MLSEIYTYGELCKNRKPSLHWVWQLLVLVDATNNGHCWKETKNRKFVCACSNEQAKGRKCPQGFKGDGVHGCKVLQEAGQGKSNDWSHSNNRGDGGEGSIPPLRWIPPALLA
ncbi:hypothetical protein ACQJBY_042469 [Aegilops geniculata]